MNMTTIKGKNGSRLTLNIRLHEPENDLFATKEGLIEHSVLIDVTFAWDGVI